jgi:chromosome segregation ATPase
MKYALLKMLVLLLVVASFGWYILHRSTTSNKSNLRELQREAALLEQQKEALQAEINKITRETMELLAAHGITEKDIQDHHDLLIYYGDQLKVWEAMSGDDLANNSDALNKFLAEYTEVKENKISALPEFAPKIAKLDERISELITERP